MPLLMILAHWNLYYKQFHSTELLYTHTLYTLYTIVYKCTSTCVALNTILYSKFLHEYALSKLHSVDFILFALFTFKSTNTILEIENDHHEHLYLHTYTHTVLMLEHSRPLTNQPNAAESFFFFSLSKV